MPQFELDSEVSIEKAVDKYIRSYCPLVGPVTIEQLTTGTPNENDLASIIKSAYTPSGSLPKVPNRSMGQMADVFWNMLRYYVVPSHAEARAWCLYLMRVCICLDELHNILPVVMQNPEEMITGAYYMVMTSPKYKDKKPATLAAEYKVELEIGEKESYNPETHRTKNLSKK